MLKNRITIILLTLFLMLFISCDLIDRSRYQKRYKNVVSLNDSIYNDEKKQSSFLPPGFNTTSQLYYLCKVWGFLKYHHENIDSKVIDVDRILLNALNDSKNCTTKTDFHAILLTIINNIQISPLNTQTQVEKRKESEYLLVDYEWMQDTICLSPHITDKLLELLYFRSGKENNFIESNQIGKIFFKNEKQYIDKLPTEEIRILGLFRYWNIINYFFVYKNFMDKNWDQVLYESIPHFQSANSERSYHWEIARLTNYLNDGHANIPVLEDTFVIANKAPNITMQKIGNEFFIKSILIPEKNKEALTIGDIVLEIDNKPVMLLHDSLKNFIGSGSKWIKQVYIGYLMLSNHRPTTNLTLLRNDQDTIHIEVQNISLDEIYTTKKISEQTLEKNYWINDSIAYLDVGNLTKYNFNENYKPIKNAKGIILDLRCYPDSYLFEKITDAFVPKRSFFCIVTYPDTRFPGMVRFNRNNVDLGSDTYYKGKVVLLVSEQTGSYSEYLAMALQQNPDLITVGRSTAGSNGNIIRLSFPGEVNTYFSGIGIYYPDFTSTQRCGIKINYVVEPTKESITTGIDVALEKAKELLLVGDKL